MGVIYVRPNLINGKKYVGQATNLKERQRKWNSLSKKYAGPAINAARAKYGIDAFGFEILKECDDKELDYWEKYYIKELNTKAPYGYNLTDGGEGMNGYTHSAETRKKLSEACKGRKLSEETKKKLSEAKKGKTPWIKGKHHSAETKKKISDAKKGENNYMYGKHLSEETKKKLSEAKKGKTPWNKGKTNIYSEETKKKISEANKGKILSEETRKKMSEKRKGENNYMYGKHHSEEAKKKISDANKNGKLSKIVIQIDKSTYETIAEFPSIREVERQLGYSQSNISKCCSGKIKSAYGYIWKYKEINL